MREIFTAQSAELLSACLMQGRKIGALILAAPKILFLDIETFPIRAYVWGRYQQNVIRTTQEPCIATFAARWNKGEVFAKGLPDYKGYKPGSYDDTQLVADLWKLLDEADIVVAHNGQEFDVKMVFARFLCLGLKPPSPFKIVDTKKAAKRVARFSSNKLDDIGQFFELGKKIKTDFDLWEGCINGDPKCWADMLRYNKQDVLLLSKVYYRLLPYIPDHPNHALYDANAACPKCGSKNIQFRGTARTNTREYRRFQCQDCGGWGRTVKSDRGVKYTHAV